MPTKPSSKKRTPTPAATQATVQAVARSRADAERGDETNRASLVRSSAAEYLTFVAASGTAGVETVYADETVWLSQKMMAQLYDVDVRTINYHLKTIFADSELEEHSVIRSFRITASDAKTYDTKHYNLSAIIAVGYKVNSERAVQFRKWATRVVEEFTIKGFAMDDERLTRGCSAGVDHEPSQLQRPEGGVEVHGPALLGGQVSLAQVVHRRLADGSVRRFLARQTGRDRGARSRLRREEGQTVARCRRLRYRSAGPPA